MRDGWGMEPVSLILLCIWGVTLSPWFFFPNKSYFRQSVCFSIASLVATFRLQNLVSQDHLTAAGAASCAWLFFRSVAEMNYLHHSPSSFNKCSSNSLFYSWSMDKYAWKVQISLRCALCVVWLPFCFLEFLQTFSIWQEKMEVIHRAKRRCHGNWLGCCLLIPQWHVNVASDWYPISSMSGRLGLNTAGALKQTRPRKMATIEYPSRRWTRSGWEVRWEIFTAFALGDAVWGFSFSKIQSCVFNQLLTVFLIF